jgi:hypothetical protein
VRGACLLGNTQPAGCFDDAHPCRQPQHWDERRFPVCCRLYFRRQSEEAVECVSAVLLSCADTAG